MKATHFAALLLAASASAQQLSGDKIKLGVLVDMNGPYSAALGPGRSRQHKWPPPPS